MVDYNKNIIIGYFNQMVNNNFIGQRIIRINNNCKYYNIIPIEDIIFILKQSETERIIAPYDISINNCK